METWIIWLIIAAVLGAAEMMTVTLAFGLVAVAALIAAVTGAAGVGGPVQFGVFTAVAALGLVVARPLAMRRVRQPALLRDGPDAVVGRTAVVVSEVTGHGGQVRIGADLWPSRSFDDALVIPRGATVQVLHVEGATALVYPRQPAA